MLRRPPLRMRVTGPFAASDLGLDFSIDAPVSLQEFYALTVNLRGFVARVVAGGGLPHRLSFCVNHVELWSTLINLPRPDLMGDPRFAEGAAAAKTLCGFDTVLPTFLTQHDAPIAVMVELRGNGTSPEAVVQLASIFFEADNVYERHDGVGVLTVNSLGRSGSSLLCRLLSLHPKMVVPTLFGQYGEVFVVGHLARAVAMLGSQGALSFVNRVYADPDFAVMPSGYYGMDSSPDMAEDKFRDRLVGDTLAHGIAMFRHAMDQVSSFALQKKPEAAYWVEKSWNAPTTNIVQGLVSRWKEIVLVRHPAAFFRSQMNYHRKLQLPDDVVLDHLAATPDKLRHLQATIQDRRNHILLVRYEDLVADIEGELRRIFGYLELVVDDKYMTLAMTVLNQDDEFRAKISSDGQIDDDISQYSAFLSLAEFEQIASSWGYATLT